MPLVGTCWVGEEEEEVEELERPAPDVIPAAAASRISTPNIRTHCTGLALRGIIDKALRQGDRNSTSDARTQVQNR
jgi:hypothetical protein